MSLQDIKTKLKELAFEKTTPFCYSCYVKCPSGICKSCGSDDLMRHLEGVGVEYGTDWVIESIVEEELEAIDLEEVFSQMIEESYGEGVQIGCISKSTSLAIKELDPIAWDLAKDEYIDSLGEDESIMEVGGDYYWIHDLESL